MKVGIVLGTRPELIKCSPVMKKLTERKHEWNVLHTNQHHDSNMDEAFWKELEIDKEKIIRFQSPFSVGAAIQWLFTKVTDYDVILVQGDTNSVLCGAIAARQKNIPVGHIEAGIRSYDQRMIEECNRQMVARISTFNFCPTVEAVNRLRKENISEQYNYVTGNTIADAVLMYQNNKDDFVKQLIGNEKYAFLTMHRAELVDNKELLTKMLHLINLISKKQKIKIIYSIHPRTKKMLNRFGINIKQKIENLEVIEPTSFTETLALEKNAEFVITDSGGIQEETCILNVPCITIRDNTERQETLKINNILLMPSELDGYLNEKEVAIPTIKERKNPYGDGNSATKIVSILEKFFTENSINLQN